jgi:hypothetical protein
VLQIDLMSQRLKLGIVGGEEEVPDPLQPRVDAESLLELGPIGLAQNRESNVRCRPQLRPETPAAARRAPRPGRLPLEHDDPHAAPREEVRTGKTDDPAPTIATCACGLLGVGMLKQEGEARRKSFP